MKLRSIIAALALAAPSFALAQAGAPSGKPQGPTDPQIAHIVVTANTIDVDAGKLAKKKTKNAEVRKFAERMITDHTAVNKQATDLAKKLKVKPEENDTSKALQKGADENMAKLKSLKGKEFDREYVDHEVAYHQAVLDAIDQALIPNAQNAELKDLLVKVRPAIDAHLQHAKQLAAAMKPAAESHKP